MINEFPLDITNLKQCIEAMHEDSILFRSDFPEYHTEYVGSSGILTHEGSDKAGYWRIIVKP